MEATYTPFNEEKRKLHHEESETKELRKHPTITDLGQDLAHRLKFANVYSKGLEDIGFESHIAD